MISELDNYSARIEDLHDQISGLLAELPAEALNWRPFPDAEDHVTSSLAVLTTAPDHPIFHAYYDLDKVAYRNGVRQAGYKGDAPWFEAVTINCRTIAVVSRWGMDIGWDEMEGDDLRGHTAESARKLGINLLSYATAQRAWMKNVARSLEFVDKDPTAAGKMSVAQVIYNGEWKTRHAGISVLLRQFNQKTEIPVKFARKEIKLSDRALFDAPLLYMTGHETFELSADETANLRAYLNNGGFLLAEACWGRKAFDASFRRAMQQVLPGESLAVIPDTSSSRPRTPGGRG